MSLEVRFADENRPLYYLLNLHPQRMRTVDQELYLSRAASVAQLYSIDNFVEEAALWYEVWANRVNEVDGSDKSVHCSMSLIDLLQHSVLFLAVQCPYGTLYSVSYSCYYVYNGALA